MLQQEFRRFEGTDKILKSIEKVNTRPVKIMEICGTHTMAIARAGIKSLLPAGIRIISGPGCPVCVTPAERLDNVFELAKHKNVIIATYGDMLKVPGTKRGENLERLKALGANVEMVYSAVDAVEIARNNPFKEVVFLGIGFETTAPGTCLALETAIDERISNFYLFSMHKLVEPVLRALINMEDFGIDGFICPGHVAVITGERGFEFLAGEYGIPSVIAGFEGSDIAAAIYRLVLQISSNNPRLENIYTRAVSYNGNKRARDIICKYFEPASDIWRGMGIIEGSGLKLREEYEKFDAVKKFSLAEDNAQKITLCRCGEIIMGKLEPKECPLFDSACTPENPVGPCMVSSEGSCAAYFKYQRF